MQPIVTKLMDTSRVWLPDVSTRIGAVTGKRIAPTDPTRMTASLFRHCTVQTPPMIYWLLMFDYKIPGPRVEDRMEFRFMRWSRNHVTLPKNNNLNLPDVFHELHNRISTIGWTAIGPDLTCQQQTTVLNSTTERLPPTIKVGTSTPSVSIRNSVFQWWMKSLWYI